jgi:hypothetical protein
MEKADGTTDASGHVNIDCDDRIDEESTIIDQGKDLSFQGGVEMNDATPMEGGSVVIGEQNIVQDGLAFIQDLLTMVVFNNDEDQASNSDEVEWEDDGIGDSTDYSEVENDSSDSSVKLSSKHIKKIQKRSSQLLLMKILMMTGFHPVWDISYQKPCFLVQILQLCRFNSVPTYKIRPAGANLQIQPIVLQETDRMLIFFPHASANQQHDNYIRSPKDHIDFSLKHNQLSPLWYIANIGRMVLRGACEPSSR